MGLTLTFASWCGEWDSAEQPPRSTLATKVEGNKGDESRVTVEVERLMKLRLVVARVGEMDLARWWNTQGQLGALGDR
jgi:hypothetical protein